MRRAQKMSPTPNDGSSGSSQSSSIDSPPYLSQKVPEILISWDQGVETHPSPTSHCPWQFPHGVSSSARKPPPAPCQGVQFLGKLPPLLPINCSEMPPLLQGWKCHSWGTAEKNSFIFLGQALPSSTQSPHDRRNWRGRGEVASSGIEMPSTELLVWSRLECH